MSSPSLEDLISFHAGYITMSNNFHKALTPQNEDRNEDRNEEGAKGSAGKGEGEMRTAYRPIGQHQAHDKWKLTNCGKIESLLAKEASGSTQRNE